MIIVETRQDLDELLSKVINRSFVMDVVPLDDERHAMNTSISLIFFSFTEIGGKWCLPIKHNEAICLPDALDLLLTTLRLSIDRGTLYGGYKYVMDKKMVVQLLGADYGFIDMDIARYLRSGIPTDSDVFATNAHVFIKALFRDLQNANQCIPLYKHASLFEKKLLAFALPTADEVKDSSFIFMNSTMIESFAWLEASGLCVDEKLFLDAFGDEQKRHIKNKLVFSQYNLFTATGRPSNRFAGVNYAALKKATGERKSFVSRFGDEGMLVLMDYNAFHPRLIAHLANFTLPDNISPYEYLAQHYFNKKNVDEEDVAVSKGLTFPQLYGGIEKRWLHIPYFAKAQEYIDHRWRFFEENGYVETPKYFRKLKACHIQDATPNKLFNYILQAFETEVAVSVLNELQEYLKDKKSKPVLYTYDSILFDCHKSDKLETIRRIKAIMERSGFPVRVYAGKSYDDMPKIAVG